MKILVHIFSLIAIATALMFSKEGSMNTIHRIAAIARTVHGYGPGIKDLAGRVQCSSNLLYRASLLGESGCDLGFSKVEKIIEVTKDFTLIDWLNNRFGFFKARPPRVAINKMSESDALNHLQIVTLAALQSLKDFFMDPNRKNRISCDTRLTECLSAVESIRKRIRGRNFNQLEIEF